MMLAVPSRVLRLLLLAACALGAAAQVPRVAGKPRPATNATTANATTLTETEGKRWGSQWYGFKEYYEEKERVCVGAKIDASTGRAPDVLPLSRYPARPLKLDSRFLPSLLSPSPLPVPEPLPRPPLRCIARAPSSLPSPHPLPAPRPFPAPRHARTPITRASLPSTLAPFSESLFLTPVLSLCKFLSSSNSCPPISPRVSSDSHVSLCQSVSHPCRL